MAVQSEQRWYAPANACEFDSPCLLFFPERIRENIRRIIARVDNDCDRLRLHIKTHKCREIIELALAAGIRKFKCATIAEAELLASTRAGDILLGYSVVGPKADRFVRLAANYASKRWLVTADDEQAIRHISDRADGAKLPQPIEVLLDLDTGMHRSGIAPANRAHELYRLLADLPGIAPGGLHVYDGHRKQRDFDERARGVAADMAAVDEFRGGLTEKGLPVPRVVVGGTPTFPVHAQRPDLECSPGTCVLWDTGYEEKLPELDFLHAAVLMTRVISRPTADRLCLDLGYKAVASDNPDPRVRLFEIPDAKAVIHNEEHLTVVSEAAAQFEVGDILYGVPYHICPTVALHQQAYVVTDGRICDVWSIAARDRQLTF